MEEFALYIHYDSSESDAESSGTAAPPSVSPEPEPAEPTVTSVQRHPTPIAAFLRSQAPDAAQQVEAYKPGKRETPEDPWMERPLKRAALQTFYELCERDSPNTLAVLKSRIFRTYCFYGDHANVPLRWGLYMDIAVKLSMAICSRKDLPSFIIRNVLNQAGINEKHGFSLKLAQGVSGIKSDTLYVRYKTRLMIVVLAALGEPGNISKQSPPSHHLVHPQDVGWDTNYEEQEREFFNVFDPSGALEDETFNQHRPHAAKSVDQPATVAANDMAVKRQWLKAIMGRQCRLALLASPSKLELMETDIKPPQDSITAMKFPVSHIFDITDAAYVSWLLAGKVARDMKCP